MDAPTRESNRRFVAVCCPDVITAVNFGDRSSPWQSQRAEQELIRPEGTWRGTDSGSIDGGEYRPAVEERKPPIETARRSRAGHRSREVAECGSTGVGSGHCIEIVYAEIDRVRRRAIVRVDIGCDKRRGSRGTIPRAVVGANIGQIVSLREKEPIRTAVNEAGGKRLTVRSW